MKTILTLTLNPTIDLSSAVAHVFPEHKLRCGAVRHDPGGGGINVSRAIQHLGGSSLAMFCCGGPTGAILQTLLQGQGISQKVIPIVDWTRQSLTISETATNQQYRFVMPGPTLTEKEWQAVLEAFLAIQPAPDLVVASGSLPPGVPEDFYARLARLVRASGGRLILDTSGPCLEAALEEGVFLVKPSLRELGILAGEEILHEEDQAREALEVVRSGRSQVVVVSLGAGGVLFASEAGSERLSAPSVTVRSRVGAGDSMVAGITLALARGLDLRDAIRFGLATGTAAVMNQGTELCHMADVERLLRQMKA